MSGEWRQEWEWHAERESERYDAMSVPSGRFPLAENLVRVRALVTARLRGSSGD
jgi:hypothetical protein